MILILDSFLNHSWFLIHSWIILDSWLLILDYRNDCILFINKILAKNSIHYYDIFIWVFKLYIWLCVLSILPASRILTIILVTLVISVLPTTSVLSAYLFYLLTCSICLLVLSTWDRSYALKILLISSCKCSLKKSTVLLSFWRI